MKLSLFFILTFLFLDVAIAHAQFMKPSDQLEGKIINEETQAPVDGATILMKPSGYMTVTNEWGKFYGRNKSREVDSIYVSGIGIEPKWVSGNDLVRSNGVIPIRNGAVSLAEVTVFTKPGDQFKLISKWDINTRSISNSQEVLQMVPGLFIGQHAGGGKAEQIFLRGFDIDHGTDINISFDGMPVNLPSHAHGQGYADLHFVIPELIENIRFEKGPYETGKGNFATAGSVEITTPEVLDRNMIKTEAGQFNHINTVTMFNLLPAKARNKGQSAFVAGELMYSDGFFVHPQDLNRLNIFTKYRSRLNVENEITFSASLFQSKWNASGQIPERAVNNGSVSFFGAIDPGEGGRTGRKNINLTLSSTLKNGASLKNQLYITMFDFELYSNFTFFKTDSINGDQIRQKELRKQIGYNGNYTTTGYIGSKKIHSEYGINVYGDATTGSELSATINRYILKKRVRLGDIAQLNTAVYIRQSLQLNDRINIDAGIRADQFYFKYRDALNEKKTTIKKSGIVSPKLSIYYQADNKTQAYVRIGKGFHSNDSRSVIQTPGNTLLPPVYSADFGVIMKPFKTLLVNAGMWYIHSAQEFIYVGDEGIVEPNGSSVRKGIDISFRYQPFKWLFIDADGNYSHARSADRVKGEDYLPLSPSFTSAGRIYYKGGKKINAGIYYRYMCKRPANENYSLTAKGYFINDLMISYIRRKYEMDFTVSNLFNVRWKETQFETESRLKNEMFPVSEIHFTPGSPIFIKAAFTYYL